MESERYAIVVFVRFCTSPWANVCLCVILYKPLFISRLDDAYEITKATS